MIRTYSLFVIHAIFLSTSIDIEVSRDTSLVATESHASHTTLNGNKTFSGLIGSIAVFDYIFLAFTLHIEDLQAEN